MDITTEIGILLTYSFIIFAIYFFGYIFLIPMKFILRILLNSILGGIFLLFFNLIGGYFGINVPINLLSAVTVGVLGVPGVVVLIII